MAVESAVGAQSKAARQRRLWRACDNALRSTGAARGRPAPVEDVRKVLQRPPRWLSARELIGMARAARGKPQDCPSQD